MLGRLARWTLFVGSASLAGCTCGGADLGDRTFACHTPDDCATGYACVQGLCTTAARDGGGSDGSVQDAGLLDGGTADAGGTDSGVADAGRSDAGSADGGPADGGSQDSGDITLVQQGAAASLPPVGSLTVTLPSPVAAGDGLIACISFDNAIFNVQSVTGGGVTWVRGAVTTHSDGGFRRTALYYGLTPSAVAGPVTVNFVGADDSAVHVSEWSHLGAPSASFTTKCDGQSLGPVVTLPVVGNARELAFACAAQDISTVTSGPTAGYAALLPVTLDAGDQQEEAYVIAPGFGPFNTAWTLSSKTNDWCSIGGMFSRAP